MGATRPTARVSGWSSRPTRATARSCTSGREAAIVTSVEPDHLDYYGGFASLDARVRALRRRSAGPGRVLRRRHRGGAPRRSAGRGVRTYGIDASAHYRITDVVARAATSSRFTLTAAGGPLGELVVPLAVKAATNAAGAARAGARSWACRSPRSRRRSRGFGGVARRFERRGERDGVTFIDDYAHLPGEVAAAIAAAREGGWRRVIAVFQPHRYTRTASLWQRLRRRVRRRGRSGAHRRVPGGGDADRGRLRPAASCTRWSTRRRGCPLRISRGRADLLDLPRRFGRGRATSC